MLWRHRFALLAALCLLVTIPLLAGDLIIANGRNWKTDVFEWSLGSPLTVNFSACPTIDRTYSIPAGGAIFVPDAGRDLGCSIEFAAVPLHPAVSGLSMLRYDDGTTRETYAVPPVGSLTSGHPVALAPARNGYGDINAYLNFFPGGAADVTVQATTASGDPGFPVTYRVTPPVTQIRYTLPLSAGNLTLTTSTPTVRIPCFMSLSRADGTNATIVPCQ